MVELACLTLKDAGLLLGRTETEEQSVNVLINRLSNELGFTELQNPSNKKWIDGLAEKLTIAEQKQLLPKEKISHIRDIFDIQSFEPDMDLNGSISLNT